MYKHAMRTYAAAGSDERRLAADSSSPDPDLLLVDIDKSRTSNFGHKMCQVAGEYHQNLPRGRRWSFGFSKGRKEGVGEEREIQD